MATMIGNESDILSLLQDLLQLDHDAVEAYEAAIARLQSSSDKSSLRLFCDDHRRHIVDLSRLIGSFGGEIPEGGDLKRFLTKGKVVLGSLVGDRAILYAMKTNEDDTNTAYERAANRTDLPAHVREVILRNLSDERRHRTWLETRLASLQQEATR